MVSLVVFVMLATSMCMLTCSAQPEADLDTVCASLYVPPGMATACVEQTACEGRSTFSCSTAGTVCCLTGHPNGHPPPRPPINYDALCADIFVDGIALACVASAECGTAGNGVAIFNCSTAGQVCCSPSSDFDSVCADIYVPEGSGLLVGCVAKSECSTRGPLGPLFDCSTVGQTCCMAGPPHSARGNQIDMDLVCGAVSTAEGENVECVAESTCISGQGGVLFPCSTEGEVCCKTPATDIDLDTTCTELIVPDGIAVECVEETVCGANGPGRSLFDCATANQVCCMTHVPRGGP